MSTEPLSCCWHCYAAIKGTLMFRDRMILCPTCGNKRCPKATFHENECTGSNEPGQPGSMY